MTVISIGAAREDAALWRDMGEWNLTSSKGKNSLSPLPDWREGSHNPERGQRTIHLSVFYGTYE